jgi:hypothetical protein
MEASLFGELSGELRNRVYQFFFRSQLALRTDVDIRKERARSRHNVSGTRSALALTAVNRQLRKETLELFWSTVSLRIDAQTLTAYSQPDDVVPHVRPMMRAHHVNQTRAAILEKWLENSGFNTFSHLVRPIELDLGMWNPRIHAHEHQLIVMRFLESNTSLLIAALRKNTAKSAGIAANCTLFLRVQLQPSTALGPICIPNARKLALVTLAKLCEGRQAARRELLQKGTLTDFGYAILANDVVMCRSVADFLINWIVQEREPEPEPVECGEDSGVMETKGKKIVVRGKGGRGGH